MYIRSPLFFSLLLLLAACSSNSPAPEVKDQASAEMECEMVTPTGSTMIKRVCRQKMTPEDRQRMQDELNQKVRPTASGTKG